MQYSSASINWKLFENYLDDNFSSTQRNLYHFFKSQGIAVSLEFIYSFFYIPCSQYFFEQYLALTHCSGYQKKSITSCIKSNLKSVISRIPVYEIPCYRSDSWVSLGFFHRHSELSSEFFAKQPYVELSVKSYCGKIATLDSIFNSCSVG